MYIHIYIFIYIYIYIFKCAIIYILIYVYTFRRNQNNRTIDHLCKECQKFPCERKLHKFMYIHSYIYVDPHANSYAYIYIYTHSGEIRTIALSITCAKSVRNFHARESYINSCISFHVYIYIHMKIHSNIYIIHKYVYIHKYIYNTHIPAKSEQSHYRSPV